MFQSDIFPPTAGVQPSLTSEQWLNGQNRGPVLVSLQVDFSCFFVFEFSTKSVEQLRFCARDHKFGQCGLNIGPRPCNLTSSLQVAIDVLLLLRTLKRIEETKSAMDRYGTELAHIIYFLFYILI